MTRWLSSEMVRPFAHLTTASLAVALDGLVVPDAQAPMPADALLAAGQTFAGLPAALAVVKQTPHDAVEVITLAVAEPFRQLGLARQLLLWLQAQVQSLGCRSLSLCYPMGHASTVALERLTSGWQHSPGLRLVHLDRAGGTAFVQRLTPLAARWLRSGRFALVRWQDMNVDLQRRLELRQQQAPPWAWSASADAALGQRDGLISQVLLERGAVVGWVVAHRVGLSLFRVTQWWIVPEWRGRGLALFLLHQACADALQAQPLYEAYCFGVGSGSEEMLQICRRHLEPLATTVWATQRALWSCT